MEITFNIHYIIFGLLKIMSYEIMTTLLKIVIVLQ